MVKWWAKCLGVVAGIFAVISIAYAQFSVPTSNRVFSGVLLSSGKNLASFEIREGAMLTVRDEGKGLWYGWVPLVDSETGQVKLKGFELTARPDGPPDIAEVVKRLDVRVGEEVALQTSFEEYDFSLAIQGISDKEFPTIPAVKNPKKMDAEILQKVYGASGGGLCSLTCGPLTVTSTSVKMSCGVCEGAR